MRTLVTPANGAVPGADVWAADNGAFSGFDAPAFLRMLDRLNPTGCVFVAAPDVVGDHWATLDRWPEWSEVIRAYGFPVAFVAQDGCKQVPDDADALFIGGSTEFKLSDQARSLIDDRWSHMGRVNSYRRLQLARSWRVDSVDGSSLSWFTDTKLAGYLAHSEHEH